MAITELTEVVLTAEDVRAPRFTPRELRMVQAQYGKAFSAIVGDEDTDDKFVVLAWLKLRRDGVDCDVTDLDDVVITLAVAEELDPTSAVPPTISPSSANGGG